MIWTEEQYQVVRSMQHIQFVSEEAAKDPYAPVPLITAQYGFKSALRRLLTDRNLGFAEVDAIDLRVRTHHEVDEQDRPVGIVRYTVWWAPGSTLVEFQGGIADGWVGSIPGERPIEVRIEVPLWSTDAVRASIAEQPSIWYRCSTWNPDARRWVYTVAPQVSTPAGGLTW